MDCQRFREKVYDHIDGQLSAAEAAELLEHAASCGRCAELLRQAEQSRSLLASLPREPMPERVFEDALAAIREKNRLADARKRRRRRIIAGCVSAAAAFMLIVGIPAMKMGSGGAPNDAATEMMTAETLSEPAAGVSGSDSAMYMTMADGHSQTSGSQKYSEVGADAAESPMEMPAENDGNAVSEEEYANDEDFAPSPESCDERGTAGTASDPPGAYDGYADQPAAPMPAPEATEIVEGAPEAILGGAAYDIYESVRIPAELMPYLMEDEDGCLLLTVTEEHLSLIAEMLAEAGAELTHDLIPGQVLRLFSAEQ